MMVMNMLSNRSGRSIANQFHIIDDEGNEFFQSYGSIIVKIDKKAGKTILDKHLWDYSVTTGKYRNQFLMENTEETKKKIKSGEYILDSLN